MDDLWALCDQEGIVVLYVDNLTRSKLKLGYYYRTEDGQPVILLDESLQDMPRRHRCVLAEELGHYFCGATGAIVRPGAYSPLSGGARAKDEHRGLRWAANYLIPTDRLALAAQAGLSSVPELADYFEVEEYMVWRKFHILRTDLREQWKLHVAAPDIMSSLLVAVRWGAACRERAYCAQCYRLVS